MLKLGLTAGLLLLTCGLLTECGHADTPETSLANQTLVWNENTLIPSGLPDSNDNGKIKSLKGSSDHSYSKHMWIVAAVVQIIELYCLTEVHQERMEVHHENVNGVEEIRAIIETLGLIMEIARQDRDLRTLLLVICN